MNTTKNISMGGYAFIIEEDAYFRLKEYTEAVKNNLAGARGADEMMSDIEGGIAEILRESRVGREVVINDDITKVIDRMGEPEVYVQDDAIPSNKKKESVSDEHTAEKRIHRDPDNKVFGGVCGGLAAYFNIDPVLVRLAFAISTFFSMLVFWIYDISIFWLFAIATFWLYVILWVVIPKAKTRIQKLQMRGKRPDLKNIESSIRSELNSVGDNLHKIKGDQTVRDSISRLSDVLGGIFGRVFKVIGIFFEFALKLLAAFASVCSLAFLVFLVFFMITGIHAINISGNEVNIQNISGVTPHLFDTPLERVAFCTALFIFLAVPAAVLLANSIRYLANIKNQTSKWTKFVIVGVWLLATSGLMYLGIGLALNFTHSASGVTEYPIAVKKGQTLRLRLGDRPQNVEGFMMSDISLDIMESADSLYTLKIIRESNGRTQADADKSQRNIEYNPTITDSTITFPELYVIPKGESMRMQSVMIQLRMPRNGKIYIEPGMERILYNIYNVQNVYDADMAGQFWIMTDIGLACQNCPIPVPDSLDDAEVPETSATSK